MEHWKRLSLTDLIVCTNGVSSFMVGATEKMIFEFPRRLKNCSDGVGHSSMEGEGFHLNFLLPTAALSIYSNYLYISFRKDTDRGGAVVRLLFCHLGEPVSIPGGVFPGFSHVGIVQLVGSFFSGISCFPRPCIPLLHTHLTSPSSALKTQMLKQTKRDDHSWNCVQLRQASRNLQQHSPVTSLRVISILVIGSSRFFSTSGSSCEDAVLLRLGGRRWSRPSRVPGEVRGALLPLLEDKPPPPPHHSGTDRGFPALALRSLALTFRSAVRCCAASPATQQRTAAEEQPSPAI
ncbi:hypothetical protein PR048_017046 [Dryococelus australis]|uniref:Uncharacterized protein n=1 Tax=Dryococelus australis TaxID=614101 RepID=A0ABQ9H8E6_9NEOP|nr:hypothetical protein PR048_017046 [Dryococelus australis]